MEGSDTYLIRPNYQHKFKPAVVKECIRETVKAMLSEAEYDPDEVSELTSTLADRVKNKVKKLGFDRYKLVVQVTIGEQRGQGVKMSSRCLWDADTDNYAEDVFMNASTFFPFSVRFVICGVRCVCFFFP
ncbi:dynein light chain Tctex-type protein 2B isoform X1 [Corythoichthys intestinalis]|uniref:dynein light chain Tctex-type protein 2B isoform X1 n=1 Tax=Corythoichthys intestinalis TaxID=161448 RepID=UPI0025A5A7DF|nr:dynein light chain Tctex-type protein 2B isoform X1 [Corythoichthys intestinalis]